MLTTRLQDLEKDSEQHRAVVDGLTTKYMETIERLQSDKARLEVTMKMKGRRMRTKDKVFMKLIRMCVFVLSSDR